MKTSKDKLKVVIKEELQEIELRTPPKVPNEVERLRVLLDTKTDKLITATSALEDAIGLLRDRITEADPYGADALKKLEKALMDAKT